MNEIKDLNHANNLRLLSMKKEIAKILLDKKAVTLNIKEPYTYVSGIRSPVYCDNRVLTYFPKERKTVCKAFNEIIKEFDVDVIAGTASSAISWAAWVSQKINKPMVYIRKAGKGYGKDKLIEGGDITGKKIIVIEDLVSTGGSSVNAVEACQEAGGEVVAMIAIFTYEFEKAKTKFESVKCETRYLTDFSTLVDVAADNNFIESENLKLIKEWNKGPTGWGPKHGFELGEKRN
jgi:orotate phosphoribosyltransferase